MPSSTSKSNKIRMVCFDLGGVLIRIHRSWEEVCTYTGLEIRDIDSRDNGESRRKLITNQFATGKLEDKQWAEQMAAAFQNMYSPDEIRHIHDGWLIEEYPEISEVISQLNNIAGITTACLSNTNPRHWKRLVHIDDQGKPAAGEPEYPVITSLKKHYASHIIGHAKPDPEIYLAFENLTGFAGYQILFFDDLQNNIQAATKRGWNTVQIDHAGDTAQQIISALNHFNILA